MIRGVRGATTVTEDSNELVLQETRRLVEEMAKSMVFYQKISLQSSYLLRRILLLHFLQELFEA